METPTVAKDDTFHLFPTLPKELRLAIWQTALSQPRIVITRREIRYRTYYAPSTTLLPGPPTTITHTLYYEVCSPPPVLTQVSSESRVESLMFYTPAFNYGSDPRYTYINFAVDTLVMSDYDFFRALFPLPLERENIQNFALTCESWEWFYDTYLKASKGPRILAGVRGLKELTIICADLDEGGYKASEKDLVAETKKCLEAVNRLDGKLDGWVCPEIKFVGTEEEGRFKGVELKMDWDRNLYE